MKLKVQMPDLSGVFVNRDTECGSFLPVLIARFQNALIISSLCLVVDYPLSSSIFIKEVDVR